MHGPRLVLASASPRRSELLKSMGLTFDVMPSGVEELSFSSDDPVAMVTELAVAKARDVSKKVQGLIIGADTEVVLYGEAFGKPVNPDDAARMLRRLSGRTHAVYTGVAVVHSATGVVRSGHSATLVRFRTLSEETIQRYVASGEPMGKAGAYAIQGLGSLLISRIAGDYSNVVGLPLGLVADLLAEFGLVIL